MVGRFGGRVGMETEWYVFLDSTDVIVTAIGGHANKVQIQPGNIEVSSIASRVSNGEVWILKSCLNYA